MYVIADLIARRKARRLAKLNRPVVMSRAQHLSKQGPLGHTDRRPDTEARKAARAHRCTMCWGGKVITRVPASASNPSRRQAACGCQ